MQVNLDLSKLEQLDRDAPGRAGQIIQKIAQDVEADIVLSFNSRSPSPAGEPPGVDTGNLKNSVQANATLDPLTWVLDVGAFYAVMLEYGTLRMAARPFVRPALDRVPGRLPPGLMLEMIK
jgi:hypothetical protein